MPEQATSQTPSQSNAATSMQADTPITAELVRQVTEKVYALWRKDLQLERERIGSHRSQMTRRGAR